MKILNNKIIILVILFVIRTSLFKVRRGGVISFDIYTIFQIFLVLLIFSKLVFDNRIKLKLFFKNKSFRLVFMFYVLGLTSVLWSSLPSFSFYMSFQNLVFLLAFYHLFNSVKSFIEMESLFFKLSFLFIFIDAVGDFSIYGFGFLVNWHNLETGGLAGMLLCYSLGELVRSKKRVKFHLNRKKKLKKVVFISVLVLILSTSSASNISALCGILSIFLLGKNIFIRIITILSMLFLIFVPEFLLGLIPFIFPGKSIDGIMSFGSRLHIWEPIIELIKEKPILGWGYGSAERITERAQVDSHNSLLGAMGGLGFLGGFMMLLLLFSLLKNSLSRKHIIGYFGLFSALISLLVNSNSFGFLSGKTGLLTLGFFMICALSFNYFNYFKNDFNTREVKQ